MYLSCVSRGFVGVIIVSGIIRGGGFDLGDSSLKEQVNTSVNSDYCNRKYECDKTNETFPMKGCHCDALCSFMNDCCKGFVQSTSFNSFQRNGLKKKQFSCIDMCELTNQSFYGALMVTKCPEAWVNSESRELCENSGRRTFPLSNKYLVVDGVMFHNLYCAYCNGFLHRSYDLITVKICTNYTTDGETNQLEKHNCKKLYQELSPVNPVSFRWCPRTKVIASCLNNTPKNKSSSCTEGGYAFVYDVYNNVFKNKYCSLCDTEEENELHCYPIGITDSVSVGVPYAFTRLVNVRREYEKEHTYFERSCPPEVNNNATSHKDHFSHFEYNKNDSGEFLCHTNQVMEKVNPQSLREKGKMYLTVICLVMSIGSLLLTLFIYFFIPKLRNFHGKKVCSLAFSLLLAQLLFLISSETESVKWLCILMAIFVHYFFFAAFCWMNVIAFDLWMTFANHSFPVSNTRLFCYYNIYAWCLPLVFIVASVILNFSDIQPSLSPRYGESGCWISSNISLLLLFIAPLSLFKLFDIVAFVGTTVCIAKTRHQSRAATGERNPCSLVLNIKLSLIMGLTWVFAFIANASDDDITWYLFIIFNTLQGLFIFLCFVCKEKVWAMVVKKTRSYGSQTTKQTNKSSYSYTRGNTSSKQSSYRYNSVNLKTSNK